MTMMTMTAMLIIDHDDDYRTAGTIVRRPPPPIFLLPLLFLVPPLDLLHTPLLQASITTIAPASNSNFELVNLRWFTEQKVKKK